MTLNLVLLAFLGASLSVFYLSAPWGSEVTFLQGLLMFSLYLAFVAFEVWVAAWLTGQKDLERMIRKVLLTHSPWILGWFAPLMLRMSLPEPHNFPERKLEILFGVIFLSHLFLFCRLLLMDSYKKKGMKNSKIFGIVSAFLFLFVTAWTAAVCEPSGDEPHYMLMAYSLIHDGDLDLSNNYQNKDYENFYHRGELQPQGLEHVENGKRYSHHPLGPVLLILPGFLMAGRLGAALTMALLAALTLFWTLRVLEETGAKGWPVHAVGIIGLFSSPLLLFSGLVFPEIPTACLVAMALYLFLKKRWGFLGLDLGLMLWMHNRNVLLVLPFLAFVVWEIWKDKKKRRDPAGRFALGIGIPLAFLVLYFYSIYGVLTPLGAHNEPFTSLFRLGHFWIGFFGLLMDQECGLWFHFPIFGLAVMGGAVLWFTKNPLRHMILGVLLFYYFFMCFYENLGLTPATRYWVGVTPLMLVAIYPALEQMKKRDGWTWLTLLSFAGGVLVNWILAAVPWMRYNKLNGENYILKIAGSMLNLQLTAGNPAFQAPVVELKSYLLSAFPVVVTIALTVWFVMEKKVRR